MKTTENEQIENKEIINAIQEIQPVKIHRLSDPKTNEIAFGKKQEIYYLSLKAAGINNKYTSGLTKEEAIEKLQNTENLKNSFFKRAIGNNNLEFDCNIISKTLNTPSYSLYFESMGHIGLIERLCTDSSTGKTFVFTGGADGILKIWSVDEGLAIASLYGHETIIIDICISNCGRFLCSVDISGRLIIWDLENLESLRKNSQKNLKSPENYPDLPDKNLQSQQKNLQSHQKNLQSHQKNLQSHQKNLQSHQKYSPRKHLIELNSEVIFCEYHRNFNSDSNDKNNELKDETNEKFFINNFKSSRKKNKKTKKFYSKNFGSEKNSPNRENNKTKNFSNNRINVLLACGHLLQLEFTDDKIWIVNKNLLKIDGIKAICVTDGGGLIATGGNWPYLVLFDSKDPNNIILLEDFSKMDVDISISNICASKVGLKIATSAANTICIYSYFQTKTNLKDEVYKDKCIIDIYDSINTDNVVIVHRIAMTVDYLLVAVCTDGVARIYEESDLLTEIFCEVGELYSHPNENIFAIVGEFTRIYSIEGYSVFNGKIKAEVKVISEFVNPNQLTDALFSNNGFYFITADSRGILRSYSIFNLKLDRSNEQFFITDFDSSKLIYQEIKSYILRNYIYENNIRELLFCNTFNSSKEKNLPFNLPRYEITKLDNSNFIKEEAVAEYMAKYKVSTEEFNKIINEKNLINEDSESSDMFIRRNIHSDSNIGASIISGDTSLFIASDSMTSEDTNSSSARFRRRRTDRDPESGNRVSRSGRQIRPRFLDDSS